MSVFLVTNETINRVVSAMLAENEACEDGDKLGAELLRMNHEALAARYGDSVPSDVTFRYRHESYMKHNRLKAMACLHYQCSEGDVPDCDLYQRLEKAIDDLAYDIATSTQEYNDAPWDVPSGMHTVESI